MQKHWLALAFLIKKSNGRGHFSSVMSLLPLHLGGVKSFLDRQLPRPVKWRFNCNKNQQKCYLRETAFRRIMGK